MYDEDKLVLEEEHEKEHHRTTDLYADIRRLDSIIRRLTRRLIKNKNNDEMLIKLANAIGILSSKKFEIVNVCLEVKQLLKGKTYYRK